MPKLVAHRGLPFDYPENSLEGFSAVLAAGAKFIETDVQLSADGVAVLSHDENLEKLAGQAISVTQSAFATFKEISTGYPARFGERFAGSRIATLAQFSALLSQWPAVTCFVELKRESLKRYGSGFVDRVVETIAPISRQSVLISFDYDALLYTRRHHAIPLGWVLPAWSDANRVKAEKLMPDYLFINKDKLPAGNNSLWQASGQWVIYTVNSVAQYEKYDAPGVSLVETDCYTRLVAELNHAG